MLVLGLGLKAKFCGLGLRGLALAKNSRPKSWQTTKFIFDFNRLEHGDWGELYFKIHVPYLLTVGNCGLVRVLEKNRISLLFIVILCIMGWPWPWDGGLVLDELASSVLALLTSLIYTHQ